MYHKYILYILQSIKKTVSLFWDFGDRVVRGIYGSQFLSLSTFECSLGRSLFKRVRQFTCQRSVCYSDILVFFTFSELIALDTSKKILSVVFTISLIQSFTNTL